MDVTSYKVENFPNSGARLAIIDMGIKKSIMENFRSLNCNITLFPADSKAEEIDFSKMRKVKGESSYKDETIHFYLSLKSHHLMYQPFHITQSGKAFV